MRAKAAAGRIAAALVLPLILGATPARACVPPVAYLHFPPGDAQVTSIHRTILENLILYPAAEMRNGRSLYEIRGFADRAGTEAYNLDLSRRRAEAVRDYLLSVGVPRDRIGIAFFGETARLVDADELDGNNRAVTVELSNPDYPLRCP